MDNKIEEMSENDFRYYLDKMLTEIKKGFDDRFNLFTKQQDRIEDKVNNMCKKIESLEMQVAKQYDNCKNTADVADLKERVPSKDEIKIRAEEDKELKKNVGVLMTIKKYWLVFVIAMAAVGYVYEKKQISEDKDLRSKIKSNTEYVKEQDSIQAVKKEKDIKSMLK